MTDSKQSQSRTHLRHLRFAEDSPDLEIAHGVHARLVMTTQAMVVQVTMTAGAVQPERAHAGETLLVVTDGDCTVTTGGRRSQVVGANEVAIVAADQPYTISAGTTGCARLDVLTPPDMRLAEEAFHQEHATHGFE